MMPGQQAGSFTMEERSSSPGLDVERIAHHLQRPGFGISELQIGPAQQVPWHSHTSVGDTFYVLAGRILVSLRDPAERIELGPGQSWGPVLPLRPHRVTNAGTGSATFLVLHGIGDYDFLPAG
jgi:quercetin dioxygenase-like cupin family protein